MGNQFLTFKLDGSQYAVEVHNVQEVLEYTEITKIPCTAPYIEGLISSREKGILVVNLRKKFSMADAEPTKETRIIVMELHDNNDSVTNFGAIADSVQEVIELQEDEIDPSPKFGNSISAQFIRGIGKKEDNFIILLDLDQIFSTEEIIRLESTISSVKL